MIDLILTEKLGTMPATVDKEKRIAEVIDVDRIAVLSMLINAHTGVAQFAFAFGGVDSTGRFHLDVKHADSAAHIHIARDGQFDPGVFDEFFAENGRMKCDFPEAVIAILLEKVLLRAAFKIHWGAKWPDLEVSLAGNVIFSGAAFRQAEIDAAEEDRIAANKRRMIEAGKLAG